jgi:hypothetical protein
MYRVDAPEIITPSHTIILGTNNRVQTMAEKPALDMSQVKGFECKHAVYTRAQGDSYDDLLTIKEIIHFNDGHTETNMRFLPNYKREIGVTREGHRTHKDKKEHEKLERLQIFTCTQRTMMKTIARALDRGAMQGGLRMASRSPYLYGCDITTPVLVKYKYQKQYPTCITDNTLASLDIETNVTAPENSTEYGKPIIVSLTCKNRAVLAVTKHFLRGIPNPEQAIQDAAQKYLGQVMAERKIELEVLVVDSIVDGVVQVIKRAHEWRPDFITIWNINFDIPKIISLLESHGINPADVFSDPEVPFQYRYFEYKEGPAKKITASGKEMTLAPAERWHTVTCPASFYFLDAMCVYYKIRIAKGKEPAYALDAILKSNGLGGKLSFKEADHVGGLPWHRLMQTDYRVEYCVYNLFDNISIELLDDKTTDLKRTVSLLSGPSEYSRFSSQPRRLCDDLHFFMLERGRMIATTSDMMADENDKLVVGLDNWIR